MDRDAQIPAQLSRAHQPTCFLPPSIIPNYSLAGLVKTTAAKMEQGAAPSSFCRVRKEQTDWTCAVSTPATCTATGTPSRQSLPRPLSLLQNDTSSSSSSSARTDDGRRTSFTAPKPLSLGSQSVTTPTTASASASAFDTPRRGKRTSLSYISSSSTSSASGRTRTGSISRTARGSRRRPSQASDTAADDWLMSEDDTSFSLPAASRAMAERDSAKVEAQFHDVRSPTLPVRRNLGF